MTPLTLDQADAIVAGALAAGRHLVAFKRQDGSGVMHERVAVTPDRTEKER